MDELLLLGTLLAGVIVLTPVSDRVNVPQPVLLTVFGLGVALVPGIAQPQVDPSLILPVLLPPLLFAATQRTTVGEFRESGRPILLLAVGLTVATAAVVAVVAHAGGLPWPAAWVLGAVVSPPDPVAATAVARRLRLPARMVTILEGEGMFNDATALVLYQVAVAAAVTGELSAGPWRSNCCWRSWSASGSGSPWAGSPGWPWPHCTTRPPRPPSPPWSRSSAYLGAEHLRGSGVLAVLALGLYLRSYGHPRDHRPGLAAGPGGLELRRLHPQQPDVHPDRLRAHDGARPTPRPGRGRSGWRCSSCSPWSCRGRRGCTPPSRSPARSREGRTPRSCTAGARPPW